MLVISDPSYFLGGLVWVSKHFEEEVLKRIPLLSFLDRAQHDAGA